MDHANTEKAPRQLAESCDRECLDMAKIINDKCDEARKAPPAPADPYMISIPVVGTAPTRGSEYAAGWDIKAACDGTILPGCRMAVHTGMKCAIPRGYYGQIHERSGLALRDGIAIGGGVIDSDYRGEIMVILINNGSNAFQFASGDRIAQLCILPVPKVEFVQVESLTESMRGNGGFGSTGVN